jgi:hypothetical protein
MTFIESLLDKSKEFQIKVIAPPIIIIARKIGHDQRKSMIFFFQAKQNGKLFFSSPNFSFLHALSRILTRTLPPKKRKRVSV